MAGAVPRVVTLRGSRLARSTAATLRGRGSPTGRAPSCVNTPHNPTGKVFSRGGAGGDRRALPRARPPLHHRRGLRAPGLRGPARPDGDAARDAGAHDHDLVLRQDVLADRLEDRLGRGAAGADRRRARGAPVHHLRDGDAAPARRGRARSRPGPEYYEALARRIPGQARLPRRGARRGSASACAPPQGTYFVCADFRRFGFDDDVAFCRHLIEDVGVAAIPPTVFYDRPEQGARLRPLRVLQEDGDPGGRGRERLEKLCA